MASTRWITAPLLVLLLSAPGMAQPAAFNPDPPFGAVPSVASFTMSYARSGAPRLIRPTTTDPNSATNWAGVMWNATGSAEFSVAYTDGTLSFRDAEPTAYSGFP